MYIKLTLRNAKRSVGDYLLYIITLIVLSTLMMFSNLLAVASGQNGLQTSAVPLIISLVMVFLLGYINSYMLRRRAKEFASYILLGMKKTIIATMFFGESLLLGSVSLVIGIAIGGLLFPLALSFLRSWFSINHNFLTTYGVAVRDTIFYFVIVQILSLLGCVWKISKLQISALLSEGRKNQKLTASPRPVFWTLLCVICILTDWACITFITNGDGVMLLIGINFISFSFIIGTWAFYKAIFHLLAWLRIKKRNQLYQGNRLYLVSHLLSKTTSNVTLNTVLSVCLMFSGMTFSVGFIMPNVPIDLFSQEMGIWMSFVEICLCIVFITIYFSILAVRQVIEVKENYNAFQILTYLGKMSDERKRLVRQEIFLKYTLPSVMCFFILLSSVGSVNKFLNTFLLTNNLLLIAVGCFTGCFLLMYTGYSFMAYWVCIKQIDTLL